MLGQKARFENLVIYANPCSMQVILLHFGSEPVSLKTQSKHVNADIIEQLTGVAGYKAHQEGQIDTICGKITRANYAVMKERAATINNPDDVSRLTSPAGRLTFAQVLDRAIRVFFARTTSPANGA